MYVVLYPHVNFISTYILWMGIIGPIVYIYTRTALGNKKIFGTIFILFGYDWQKEEMKAQKRLNLVLVLAFMQQFAHIICFYLDYTILGNRMSVVQSIFPVMNFMFFWMHFGEAMSTCLMLIIQTSEKPSHIRRNKMCYIVIVLIISSAIYGGVYNGLNELMAQSAFEAEEGYTRTDGCLFYVDDNYEYNV